MVEDGVRVLIVIFAVALGTVVVFIVILNVGIVADVGNDDVVASNADFRDVNICTSFARDVGIVVDVTLLPEVGTVVDVSNSVDFCSTASFEMVVPVGPKIDVKVEKLEIAVDARFIVDIGIKVVDEIDVFVRVVKAVEIAVDFGTVLTVAFVISF